MRLPPAPDARDFSSLPKISIVTPSYEQGRFLRDSIESVLNQSYPCLEYFVQDGGSTDNSLSVLSEFEGRLSGWSSAPDHGQAQAINRAFRHTGGEIMGWLNSDDLLLPGSLHRVASYFQRHPEISVVYGNRVLVDEQGLEIGRWILPEHDAEILRWMDYVPQETLFWRRSAWEAVGGGLDESLQFALDWDILLRFQEAGARFARLPHFIGAFRVHPEQKTSAHMDSVGAREIDVLRNRYLGFRPTSAQVHWRARWYFWRHLAEHTRMSLKSWINRNQLVKTDIVQHRR
jgi:glycosyltransferase involved in cell wall biosynthesis